jgi:hypothetical protein
MTSIAVWSRAGIPCLGVSAPGRDSIRSSVGAESFVDDLDSSRGVVLGRAATTLRSIETHPWTGGIRWH